MKNLSVKYLFVLCLGILLSITTADAKPMEPAQEKMTKKELRQQRQIDRLENKLTKAKTEKSKVRIATKIEKLKNKKQQHSARNTMAWIGLTLGILGFLMVFVWGNAYVFLTGLLFTIAGLVLSILGVKSEKKGAAITGIVFSSLGLFVGLIALAFIGAILAALAAA